jgi:hypothetical protein
LEEVNDERRHLGEGVQKGLFKFLKLSKALSESSQKLYLRALSQNSTQNSSKDAKSFLKF